MNNFTATSQIEEKEIASGIFAKFIHMENMTVGHVRFVKGAVLPLHHHIHEQVTNIIKGEFEMTVDGETQLCKAGDIVVLPANIPHTGVALTDCYMIDIFQPVREDYKKL